MKRQPLTADMSPAHFGQQAGTRTESSRYYYVPSKGTRPDLFPASDRGVTRETAAIACTVPGAAGPFTMTRTVTYGPWVLDPADDRRDEHPISGTTDRTENGT